MHTTGDDRTRLAELRAALPATRAGIYLNTGTAGPLSVEVAAAMGEVAERELAVGRATGQAHDELNDHLAEARAACAAILGTDLDQVAMTHSTTEGMNLAVGSIAWRAGDRVVTTNLEHPGLLGPLEAARARHGITVVVAQVGDGGDDGRTLAALEEALAGGRARMVALSHVAWSTGAVLPIREVADLARGFGAMVAVDGAQAGGAIPVSFDASGADFYAVSGQKWLLGPEGTGALAVRRAALADLVPPAQGPYSYVWPSAEAGLHLWPDARRYESGGLARPPLAGLARSAGWLAMYVGLPWAHARAGHLARSTADRLAEIPGVQLITPRARMATLVTFRIAGWSGEQVVAALGRRILAYPRSIPGLDAVRLSIGFFLLEEELERVVREVAVLAAHSPESLPERPAIQFLDAEPA